ncbi:MAG: hypothetical protein QM796_09685 [Chthoniobacteraceae bacterium]
MMGNNRNAKPRNQRISSPRQRRQRHLLDVKVRSRKATEQRNQKLVLWVCRLVVAGALIGGTVVGGHAALRKFLWQNKEFQISEIKVNTDGSLTREEILKAADIRIGGKHLLGEARRGPRPPGEAAAGGARGNPARAAE